MFAPLLSLLPPLLLAAAAAVDEDPCNVTVINREGADAFAATAAVTTCAEIQVSWVGHIVLTETINVRENVVMTVAGQSGSSAAIDGQGRVQLFSVAVGGTLQLRDLRLTRGYSATTGGAVNALGNTTITDCSFFKCGAFQQGGAIFGKASAALTCDRCRFYRCSADEGGAVYLADGTAAAGEGGHATHLIIRSDFQRCFASSGGSISANADFSIVGSSFVESSATDAGGALILKPGSFCTVRQTTFANCSAIKGGAIFSAGGFETQGSSFFGNRALGSGGAVVFTRNATIVDTSFYSNTAALKGGALYSFTETHLTLSGSTFKYNSASGGGGALFFFKVADPSWPEPNVTAVFAGNDVHCCYNPSSAEHGSCADVDAQWDDFDQCCPPGTWVGDLDCHACTAGFDCSGVGVGPAEVPMEPGYWRANLTLMEGRACLFPDACPGGAAERSTDEYCAEGYKGPYCAVCASGYSSSVGYTCTKCDGKAVAAAAFLVAFVAAALLGAVTYTISDLHADGGGGGGSAAGVGFTAPNQHHHPAAAAVFTTKTAAIWGKLQRLPLNKLRTAVVVLQIVTSYVAVTGARYPKIYQNFLAFAGVITLNLNLVVSFGCVLPFDFYQYLLLVTLAPLAVIGLLGLSLALARHRSLWRWRRRPAAVAVRPAPAGDDTEGLPPLHRAILASMAEASGAGKTGEAVGDAAAPASAFAAAAAQQSRWDRAMYRHALVFMVFTFLVYTTSSTVVFQAFACDRLEEVDTAYLRVDYSIKCYTPEHNFYMAYAAVMALIYPIGIPAVYAFMLWRGRRTLAAAAAAARANSETAPAAAAVALADPSVRTTRFLWQPYKREVFWWELAECGRRVCLTGVLVFILPGTIGQAEWACLFAVASLAAVFYFLPHDDAIDAHMYCLGCIIIFCSMFLALVIQAESSIGSEDSKEGAAVLLVGLNIVMLVATVAQCLYVAFQDAPPPQPRVPKVVALHEPRKKSSASIGDGGGYDSNGSTGGGGVGGIGICGNGGGSGKRDSSENACCRCCCNCGGGGGDSEGGENGGDRSNIARGPS
ncbi:unnamed protein product [Phaeothamnion confervicola]